MIGGRIAAALLALAVIGCATTIAPPQPAVTVTCAYPERDLTRPWSERRYWCVPEGVWLAHRPVAPAAPAPASRRSGAAAPFDPDLFGPRP